MRRRELLLGLAAATVLPVSALGASHVIDVYKNPACGCCGEWIKHLRSNGFEVRPHDVADSAEYRQRYGVPQALASCHTGLIGGYAIEGHVPAREIKRLLTERPRAQGLAVPGMPIGSPGMEQDGRRDPYEVLLFQRDGRHIVYARY